MATVNGRRIVQEFVEHEVRFRDDAKETIPVEDEDQVDEVIAFCKLMNNGRAPSAWRRFVWVSDWERVVAK